MARRISVEIVGDSRSVERAFKRAGSAGATFGSRLKSIGKAAALGFGAALIGVGAALRAGFAELGEAQKVAAQTNAVLRSTGGVANVTAGQVDKLATSISRMSGIDDEAIAGAQNILLTFTNIRNEAGKGNRVFDRTTTAVVNMAQALGMDLNSAAMMVGKAMNQMDVTAQGNVRGFMALRRIGVQISPTMMSAAKAFIEAGKPMEAQKLLLQELNTEFGGSAKAFGTTMPGALGKLRNAFDELMAAFATGFLPIVLRVANAMTKKIADPAFVARVRELGLLIGTKIYNAFARIGTWFHQNWPAIKAGFARAGQILREDVAPALRLILRLIERIAKLWGKVPGVFKMSGKDIAKTALDKVTPSAAPSFPNAPRGGRTAQEPANPRRRRRRNPPTRLYNGPRALGGPVMPGGAYLVGERGPEMFVPNQAGNIMAGGGGGGATHIHVHVGSHKVAEAIVGDIQRLAKRGSSQQRGRLGGQNLSLS